jgi:hypothetical protein
MDRFCCVKKTYSNFLHLPKKISDHRAAHLDVPMMNVRKSSYGTS